MRFFLFPCIRIVELGLREGTLRRSLQGAHAGKMCQAQSAASKSEGLSCGAFAVIAMLGGMPPLTMEM